MNATRIGILGSGDVGQALGRGLAKHGHDVTLGTRDPKKLEAWKKETPGKVSVGSFADAAKHGDVVMLALAGSGTISALDIAGPRNFAGKLVLDATNPLDFSKGMPPGLAIGTNDSLGEQVQRKLADAHVVKCFNTVSCLQMVDPKFKSGAPPMLIAGNDAAAKKRTDELLRGIGWPGAMDVGGIDGARWLEALVPLWVRIGASTNTWMHAFRAVE